MNQYHLYTIRDFALDEYFQEWVLRPDVKNTWYWDNWQKEHPEKKEVIAAAIRLVKSIQFREYAMPPAEKEVLWDNIWDSIATESEHETVIPAATHRHFPWKYAAAVVILLVAGTLWFMRKQATFTPVTASMATQTGQTKHFLLPDSSEVWLNASSKIQYTQKDLNAREVWLDGEAWFHVKHTAANSRFIVHTYDKLSVEVLGTQFNVNNAGDKIAVALQEGSIKLNITEQQGQTPTQLYLRPGEALRYNKTDGAYTKSKTDADKAGAWTRGQLIMEDYTVADAIQFMQQVFDRHVTVKDKKTLRYGISGSMPISYNADTMLIQFEKAFNTRFFRQDK
ncbi:FecR family protein [Chitinophaga pinensis]|uniref:Anti-FecI sigma factor, FecR n=1 Tax=Chitinophaga pinensis (strain ATCC 43595 / DSM 2588 / LMG 13176 / NBRC 15968 / NCIMB 11800 / UQM 2034) TaxID=485918 RepID=A0A979G381_CHIPD|nr:FecR domain-containing protein [Chitinophaga pinensis]ACU59927.1 anti-FecI sigma factor, FecR [Chitinophaga pinensis DSM 2588]